MTTGVLLSTTGLKKSYGKGDARVHAVAGIDFSLRAGELVAIMGASGSGKSTLMHLIGAIATADAGSVRFDDQELSTLSDRALTKLRRTRIGMIFQAYNLMPTLSAEHNVALPLLMDGVARSNALARARAGLEQVGLNARATHLPAQLSGGEQQRVAIARALVIQPRLVIADEPTGNLDSDSAARVCALFNDLVRAGDRAVLLVTHESSVAFHADRIVVLRDGVVASEFQRRDLADVAELAQRYLQVSKRT